MKHLFASMNYLLAAACSLCSLSAFSQVPPSFPQAPASVTQDFPPADYPRGYFRDPLNIPMSLAANFGELRPNHYHMGLDIRTQKKVNLPVFAAADGYIAKVVIEPGGFGQAIYINHPNGYTTLYAHLNKFMPALAAYVQRQQYKLQSWKLAIDIPPGLFPVRKGDQVAYSGSTGGSEGPHLHFEIRRTSDDVNLNPLLFGLPVPDHTPPVIRSLAIYDRNKSVYEQSPRILPVHPAPPAGRNPAASRSTPAARNPAASNASSGNTLASRNSAASRNTSAATKAQPADKAASANSATFQLTPARLTVNSSRISFAIAAFDTQSGSSNPNGIFQAILYDNDSPVIGFQMDRISYDNTRDLNAHIDYKTRETGGPFLQQLSELPGYTGPSIYRSFRQRADHPELPADGVIDLADGAMHKIRIVVKDADGNRSTLEYQVRFAKGTDRPESVGDSIPGPVTGKRFYPGMLDGFETDNCAFYIGEKSLYDSVFIHYGTASLLSLPGAVSDVHAIGAPYIPLREPMLVRIRPNAGWRDAATDHVVMVCFSGNKKEVQRPEWQGGWASAKFREFGDFQLVEDNEAPVITPIGLLNGADLGHSSRIAISVKDNLGAIRSFRAELDGQWLCFTNDKGLAFIYTFDEHCPPGKHTLTVTAEDEAGNKATGSYAFTR
jgi:murein DD-endopeptidase MepM/ murein hydrolase activator NlpD